jgi:hypothetical protein
MPKKILVEENRETTIYIEKHSSARHLVLSYYGTDYKSVRGNKEFFNQESDIYEKSMTIQEAIDHTKDRGLWGYCSINNEIGERVIHYWIDKKKVETCDIGELLAHEMAHAIGIKSERCAMQYAYITSIVIQLLFG